MNVYCFVVIVFCYRNSFPLLSLWSVLRCEFTQSIFQLSFITICHKHQVHLLHFSIYFSSSVRNGSHSETQHMLSDLWMHMSDILWYTQHMLSGHIIGDLEIKSKKPMKGYLDVYKAKLASLLEERCCG